MIHGIFQSYSKAFSVEFSTTSSRSLTIKIQCTQFSVFSKDSTNWDVNKDKNDVGLMNYIYLKDDDLSSIRVKLSIGAEG